MNNSKQLLGCILMMLMMATLPLHAGRYKILSVNKGKAIRIGGHVCKTGDTSDDKASISWISDGQTIKVLNLNTQKVLILKAKDFKKQESKSLYSYLTSQKYMSVRSFTPTDDDGANNRDGKNKMKNKKKNKSDDEKK